MKQANNVMLYQPPLDIEILAAYLHKNADYDRRQARRIRRALYRARGI